MRNTRTLWYVGGGVGGLLLLGLAIGQNEAEAEADDDNENPQPDVDTPDPDEPEPTEPWEPPPEEPTKPGGFKLPGGTDPKVPFTFSPFVLPTAPVVDPGLGDMPSLIDPYPTGGRFYQVVLGDTFGGKSGTRSIAYRYLLSEGFRSAQLGGLSGSEAASFAKHVAASAARRNKSIKLLGCSGWNDGLYATFAFSSKSLPSATGRAIRLLPRHADNKQLLLAGEDPKRNINMAYEGAASRLSRGADSSLRSFEFLWMPALNLERLWTSGGTDITVTGMDWSDGSTKAMPPPEIVELGFYDGSGLEETTFGCPSVGVWELSA